jgi:LuxR family maltose regulon positive regulatory protein
MGGPYTVRVWPFRQNGHGNKAALHAEFFMTSGNISFHCAVNNTGCQPATTGWKGFAMQYSDILKRISGPILSPTILHRQTLVEKLNKVIAGQIVADGNSISHYKLVVLCAPAGYGKTTLLADFAQHTSFPCCWYFLDRSDADKITFLKLLILSIRYRFPHFGKTLDSLLSSAIAADINHLSHGQHLEAVIDALTTAIASDISERFAFFLCNYHEINTCQTINTIVNQLLKKLPQKCILVIESRAVPNIDFASLLVHDDIIGFDHRFLSFTTAEIQDLARLQGVAPLQEREAEQLTRVFDGWIAGILLGTRLGDVRILHSRRDVYLPASVPDMQIDRQNLFAYLVNEVFSRDQEVYNFLKGTAVLQQMTPALCNALLDSTDAAERLQYLEQQGLFVTRSGGGSQVIYTCHPILRELLCDELRQQSPERFVSLHRRAMELWKAAHNSEQAIYHAHEAGLEDMSAQLIQEAYEKSDPAWHIEMLSRWIDALSGETLERYPRLLLIRANIYLLLGDSTLALPLLARASDVIMQQPSSIDNDELPLLQAAITIARSKALFQTGEYVQAQQLCQQVIQQIPINETALQAEAHMRLGVCANLLGDFTSGIAYLQKALQLWGRNSERRQTAELHSTLASTYSLIGNVALAEHHLSRATKCWDRLQDEWGKVDNLINMGVIKHREGELATAETFFQEALTIARGRIHFRRGEAYALVSLGGLYQDQGLYEQSLAVTEDGLGLARQLKDRYLINCTLCILAITYLLMGDATTALMLVSEVNLPTAREDSGGYERARYELTRGLILLYQHRYDEAYACLAELERSLSSSGLQGERLCATLRTVECQLAQGYDAEALCRLEDVAALIRRNDYEQLVLRELRLLPTLERAIRHMPQLEDFRRIIQGEIAPEEIREDIQPATSTGPITGPSVANATPRLKILALGEPAIFIDEQPVTHWRVGRAMELLFLLLDRGHPLHKEQIIAALWPEMNDEHIRQTLHSTIYYLRKTLGESCVVSRASTYQLNLSSLYGEDVWYDVTAFQEHYNCAREALALNDEETVKNELTAMVSLYRGDYVQSFYSDWCTFQRNKLRVAYLDARHQLARIAWRHEEFDESAAHWQHMLAVDNCLEDAHYGLMLCYLRQGKRGLALHQYRCCVEVLQHELGAAPGPAIQNLFQRLTRSSKKLA